MKPVTHIGRAANQTQGFTHVGHKGVYARIHSDAPPPVEEYDKWLFMQLAGTRGKQTNLTGLKLRRAVIMRRNGCSQAETASAIGVAKSTLAAWLSALPEGLAT